VGRRDVEAKLLYQSGQARRLPLGQLQHESCERRGVDDRVLQRTFEPAPDQPAVKGIVAVLDQHSSLGETKECPARVTEFGGSDQHRPIDVVPLFGVGIDRRSAIDQRVEERKRA
jgi:hypothetical protein